MRTDARRIARARAAITARWREVKRTSQAGMATAEYAIGTLAAVAFAALLMTILKSDEVRGLLLGIVKQALSIGS